MKMYTLSTVIDEKMTAYKTGNYDAIQFWVDDLPTGMPLIIHDENGNDCTHIFCLMI